LAAQQTGNLVADLPELVLPVNTDGPPQAARWHLTLARPSLFRRVTDSVSTTDVFVGLSRTKLESFHVSVGAQAQADFEAHWAPAPNVGESGAAYFARANAPMRVTHIVRQPRLPTRFEQAALAEAH